MCAEAVLVKKTCSSAVVGVHVDSPETVSQLEIALVERKDDADEEQETIHRDEEVLVDKYCVRPGATQYNAI